MAPRDAIELRRMLKAAFEYEHPVAIRFPKGPVPGIGGDRDFAAIPPGKAEILKEGDDLVLAYGSMVYPALEAAWALENEGIRLAVADAKFAKPLDEELILRYAGSGRTIITAEEGILAGGFGSAVRELLDARGRFDVRFLSVGVPIEIYPVGKADQIKRQFRIDAEGLKERFRDFIKIGVKS
jgi:1-deoxy-D-xylulose-5-phosphate synthase